MGECRIVIGRIASEGSVCEICGKSASWQMYCKDCGLILRFYCDEHAYISQGDKKLEKTVKKAYQNQEQLKTDKKMKKAQDEWQAFINQGNK